MGLREFEGKYPAESTLVRIIENRKGYKTALQQKANVVVLADAIAEEGSYGLRDMMRRLREVGGVAIQPDRDFFRQIPSQHLAQIKAHLGAILFGNSVFFLDDMRWEGSFVARVLIDRFNTAISGTMYPTMTTNSYTTQRLSVPEWRALGDVWHQDPSGATFFESKGFVAMPSDLRRLLLVLGVLPDIQAQILPLYRARTPYLLSGASQN